MKQIDVLPLSVDLVVVFFNSARDALRRGKLAKPEKPETGEVMGLFVFNESAKLVQAVIETAIASFLTVEAVINLCYFEKIRRQNRLSETEKIIKNKWGYSINITDKLSLLLDQYTTVEIDKIQPLLILFKEFTTFRNKIIHSRPEQYDALVEPSGEPNEIIVHALDRMNRSVPFSTTQFSEETGRIGFQDAEKCYEIMLLILALLDGNFQIVDLELSWYAQDDVSAEIYYGTVIETIEHLSQRYFMHIDPNSYVIKKILM